MKNIHIKFREHFFLYIFLPLIILVGVVSYYRFIIKHDYVVSYQGVCNPATGKCFMSCNDNACTKPDYYSEMQKYEPDLYKECGQDITDCAAASVCLPGDRKCSITYCDKSTSDNNNVCQTPVEKTDIQNNSASNTNI